MLTLLVVLAAAACGGGEATVTDSAAAEAEWQAVLDELGVTPAPGLVELTVAGAAPELDVTITVPKDGRRLTFGDGLYGVLVYSFADGAWARADTADVRTEIAPIVEPGQRVIVTVPVEEAPSYRVVVPVGDAAAWTDVP